MERFKDKDAKRLFRGLPAPHHRGRRRPSRVDTDRSFRREPALCLPPALMDLAYRTRRPPEPFTDRTDHAADFDGLHQP